MNGKWAAVLVVGAACVAAAGCRRSEEGTGPAGDRAAGALLVTGAGATFPYPLYSKWFAEYNALHPDLRFNYQSIGSGGGIQQITRRTVAFGASDAPMTDEELAQAPDLVHIPTVLGAVVVAHNTAVENLRLTPELIAGIFLGEIVRWDSPGLRAVNPEVALPDLPITVVQRSDGSGTTAIFTDYLAKVSPAWKERVGAGKSVRWPVGLGAKGNEGVTGMVRQTPGALGYVELAYAHQNRLATAAIRNRAGNFVSPSIESTSAAAAGVELPADFRVSITDPAAEQAYPLASFTYLLLPQDHPDARAGAALIRFLWWAMHEGQQLAAPLDYAPLPEDAVRQVERKLRTLTVQGQSVDLSPAR